MEPMMACVDDSVMASLVAIATTPRLRLQPTFNGSATTDYYATVPHSAILVHVRALTAHCRAEARINSVNGALRLVVDLPAFVPLHYFVLHKPPRRFALCRLDFDIPLSSITTVIPQSSPPSRPHRGYHPSLFYLGFRTLRVGLGAV